MSVLVLSTLLNWVKDLHKLQTSITVKKSKTIVQCITKFIKLLCSGVSVKY